MKQDLHKGMAVWNSGFKVSQSYEFKKKPKNTYICSSTRNALTQKGEISYIWHSMIKNTG
jgi:hypothetical protein